MNDPHVVSITYRLETIDAITYVNPPPVYEDREKFSFHLENNILKITFKDHFSSAEIAKEAVKDFIKGWELYDALERGRKEISFFYQDAEVIDRNPPPPNSNIVIQIMSGKMIVTGGNVSIHVTRVNYNPPPSGFLNSPDTETLWHRYEMFTEGREPLTSMAFFCLSYLEYLSGNRHKTAKKFCIDYLVLSELGKLTALGDAKTARKVDKTNPLIPLTSAEENWIQAAVKAIIKRVAQHTNHSSLPKITMDDLPAK